VTLDSTIADAFNTPAPDTRGGGPTRIVLSTPEELSAFRKLNVSPEVLDSLIAALGRSNRLVINWDLGLGKTYMYLALLRHPSTWQRYKKVVLVVYSWRLAEDLLPKLREIAPTVTYPRLEVDAPCKGEDSDLKSLIDLNLSSVARAQFCDNCKLKPCSYVDRMTPVPYRDAQIVVVTDGLLSTMPSALERMGLTEDTLVIFDEARGAGDGFWKTFRREDVLALLHSVVRVSGLTDLEITLRSVAQGGPIDYIAAAGALKTHNLNRLVVQKQFAADHLLRRYDMDTVLAYAWAAVTETQRCWHEDGTYGVGMYPTITGPALILGAYLEPSFLQDRYGFPTVSQHGQPVRALHAESMVVVCPRPALAPTGSLRTLTSYWRTFAAIAAEAIQAGKTVALVTRKLKEDNPMAPPAKAGKVGGKGKKSRPGVTSQQALQVFTERLESNLQRTVTIIHRPPSDAERADPYVIPVITYGMIGLGSYESYDYALGLLAYHVPIEAIVDQALSHLPPSARGKYVMSKSDVRVPVLVSGPQSSDNLRRIFDMYRFLEADVTLQAFGRVRYTIRPRGVFMNLRFRTDDFIPRVVTVEKPSELRALFHLRPEARMDAHRRQLTAILEVRNRGGTMAEAARAAGISVATAERLVQKHRTSAANTPTAEA
jgi:hypothetical protein